jgi:hypothetical protein
MRASFLKKGSDEHTTLSKFMNLIDAA